jgi:hypothetical protein
MERSILAAIAMHPDPRPQNIAAFRELLNSGSLPSTLAPLMPAQGEWRRALTDNRMLLILAGAMLALAVLATFIA